MGLLACFYRRLRGAAFYGRRILSGILAVSLRRPALATLATPSNRAILYWALSMRIV